MNNMKVKDMIELLKRYPQDLEVLVSSDEELNILYEKFEISLLDKDCVVIYGLSGYEIDEG